METINQMSRKVSRGSGGDNQADEQAGVQQLHWGLSGRRAGRCHEAEVAIIRQMRRQVSSSFAGDYEAEEQAGVARISWRISSR